MRASLLPRAVSELHITNCSPLPGEAKEARDELYEGQPHESKLSHELIAGAASFEAMKLYEDRQRKQGTLPAHSEPPQRSRAHIDGN